MINAGRRFARCANVPTHANEAACIGAPAADDELSSICYCSPMLALTMLLAIVAQPTQSLDSARDFVQAVYARYNSGNAAGPDFRSADGLAVFSPSLFNLIKQDVGATPQGFAGRLDFDPICSCHDSDGLRVEALTLHPTRSHSVLATVTLRYADATTRTINLTLVPTSGTWRVYDVSSASVPSLRKFLSKDQHGQGEHSH